MCLVVVPLKVSYIIVFYTTVVVFLPLVLLMYFNTKIILQLQRSRRRMARNSLGKYRGHEESWITVVMVAVIAELIICHIPDHIIVVSIDEIPSMVGTVGSFFRFSGNT